MPGRSRLRLTPVFLALLAAGELTYLLLDPNRRAGLVGWASTNVDRLRTEPVGPLIVSPFVVTGDKLLWFAAAAFAVWSLERAVGWARSLFVLASGQVVGTLLSEGIVWWRVGHGRLPHAALAQPDVGVSYVVVAGLAGCLLVNSILVRIVAGLMIVVLADPLLEGLSSLEVSAVGHLTAAATGLAAVLFARNLGRSPVANGTVKV